MDAKKLVLGGIGLILGGAMVASAATIELSLEQEQVICKLKETAEAQEKAGKKLVFLPLIGKIKEKVEVPFTANEAPKGTEHTRLIHEYRKLFRFVKGGDNTLKQMKREQMFIQMLEGLHSEEAELICLVKDKSLQDKYRVTKAVVEEAFPQINWGGRS